MFLDLDITAEGQADVPPEWAAYITATRDGFQVASEQTGGVEVFLYCGASVAAVATNLGELLDRLREKGIIPALSAFGISSLLHHGFVPLPHCEYEGTYYLSVGDVAHVFRSDGAPSVDLSHDFPWLVGKSRKDSVPDPAMLLHLLTAATERKAAEAGNSGFLMLSSGKDSQAVALALAEAGLTYIPSVTFSSGAEDPEPPVAADVCRTLGLDHVVVEMPRTPSDVARILTTFFESSARPGVDLSQIPYVFATAAATPTSGAVFDGGGNDAFMGYPVTGKWLAKVRFRMRGKALVDVAQKLFPVDSPLNYVARTRPETTFPGRTIRFHESRSFMPGAVDTRPFWRRVERETAHLDLIDLFGAVGERHVGYGASMKKHVLAANAIGMDASLPWCDSELADYYFNLPERYRYDLKTGENKVLLRRMLLQYLDYDANKIGKHYFGFAGAKFVMDNKDYIRSEIEACSLWDTTGLDLVRAWLDKVGSRPLLYHSILTVFMVSGWHNHSRFLTPNRVLVGQQSTGA